MDNEKSKDIPKKTNKISVNLSAGPNKIKYYECSDNNCIFEILDENEEVSKVTEKIDENLSNDSIGDEPVIVKEEKVTNESIDEENEAQPVVVDGEIIVKSILDHGAKDVLEGVKINLYKINGLSPVLLATNTTDHKGKAIFSNVEEGNYRVIEIVDKKFFEKPKYINWNEITIDNNNRKSSILVINRLKKGVIRNKHN